MLSSPGVNSVTQEGNDIIHFNLMFRYVQYEMQCFFLIPADYVIIEIEENQGGQHRRSFVAIEESVVEDQGMEKC